MKRVNVRPQGKYVWLKRVAIKSGLWTAQRVAHLMNQTERSLIASIASHESWARTPDRAARTAPARMAMMARFERDVDPDNVLPPHERAKRADNAKTAYYKRLALKSARARTRRAKVPSPH